jgi:choline-sulfatase
MSLRSIGALAVVVCTFAQGLTILAATNRLNLISIVTDDQAAWSIGAYGNSESKTPHMDRLAAEGARFVNAFTCTPVCSPSRAAFLTGRYGTQLGITDWISPREARAGVGLPPDSVTWPEVLQRHGYRTALLGKWHLGDQAQFHPTNHGFHYFYGFLGGGTTPIDPTFEVNGVIQRLKGPEPDLLVSEAVRWLRDNATNSFALSLHFRAPHTPYGPVPEEDIKPFAQLDPSIPDVTGINQPQVKAWTREYYASIHSVDRNLGRLLKLLDELDLTRRTIVLFTSDHGYNIGHHRIHTKGNGWWVAGGVTGPKRPNMFDTSIKVPLLVRWPAIVKGGTIIEHPVSNIDAFATILALLNIPAPRNALHEGIDWSPLLRGERLAPRDAVFGQYDLHNGGLAYMRMIRTSEWKLVRHHRASGLDELYHLAEDPEETRNLFGQAAHSRIRRELQDKLAQWQRAISDPLLQEGE